MFKPNPVEFELPYEEGLLLDIRPEWIAEQKVEGVRAVLEFGRLQTPHTRIAAPGDRGHCDCGEEPGKGRGEERSHASSGSDEGF